MSNRQQMMKLCRFVRNHITSFSTSSAAVTEEIQSKYNTWQYEPRNETCEIKVRANLPLLREIHTTYVDTFTNQVNLLARIKAHFLSKTEAMYDGWIRKYRGGAKVREYKELVRNCLNPQSDILTILSNLKKTV